MRVKKLLRPSAGGVQKLTAWSTTRWLGAEKWANYLAAGWLCPTNPASETGKKSRFIASGGAVAGEAGGGGRGKASSGLRRYAGRRTSSWHPLFRMNNQLLTLHGSGGCIVWHQFLRAAGKKTLHLCRSSDEEICDLVLSQIWQLHPHLSALK